MAYRDSTSGSGTSATPSVAVPAGVAIGDIVVLVVSADGNNPVVEPGDWPAASPSWRKSWSTAMARSSQSGGSA